MHNLNAPLSLKALDVQEHFVQSTNLTSTSANIFKHAPSKISICKYMEISHHGDTQIFLKYKLDLKAKTRCQVVYRVIIRINLIGSRSFSKRETM